ncbi:NAD(+) diphosphatase [Mycobacterium koreense]|uniref:NAD(+) diphosphatase n=1 Tax=Mycolicibacillus koreensis TaxID=1069220 RepID=A0A7I7SDA3_9MYCO|nr:NAD(+) diphosphatase [Mycolicibacillus koreensis]MCV7249942.1 NAD(+) diphosphatase [Mycolicibacillus koreensis]OSC34842.1 NADH pyrophosphatase [Mycolicibacillus koreensis]BBY54703.1 NADH pyrophosphatase [Mycolicibacillus koreensis]
MEFRLQHTPLLSRVGADRSDQLRTDVDAAVAGWAQAALLRIDGRNQVLVTDGGRVVVQRAADLADAPPRNAVFLGRIDGGRHVWAIRDRLAAPDEAGEPATVLDLRRGGHHLDDVSAQLVASAVALLNWHERAQFSAVDGTPTRATRAGWARVNPLTGDEEFPRIDPAVICLVHDDAGRAVLARQAGWPPRLFSLLAGFVEAGESLESCVVREIREEIGLRVHDVRYLGSQPWPFPRSLMVGFHAVADPGQEFVFADGEIVEAAWFTREHIAAALDAGDWSSNSESPLLLPASISIAREIIESWVAAG